MGKIFLERLKTSISESLGDSETLKWNEVYLLSYCSIVKFAVDFHFKW